MMDFFDRYKVSGINNASFWKKLAAFIFDLLIINLVIFSQFSSIFGGYFENVSMSEAFNPETIMPSSAYWIMFVVMLLVVSYFAFFDYYLGQTPGKMIMRIKVISVKGLADGRNRNKKSDGSGNQDITLWRAFFRNCYLLPFFPFYLFWIIEPIYLALYNERLLERLTYTRTVDVSASKKLGEYKLDKVK